MISLGRYSDLLSLPSSDAAQLDNISSATQNMVLLSSCMKLTILLSKETTLVESNLFTVKSHTERVCV